MKRFGGFASGCVVAALMFLAPLANAQVLQQVPSDALVVVKINKLKPVSDKVALFMQQLGLAAFNPAFNDPLGMLKQKGKIQAGVDDNGEAAFVFANAPKDGRGEPAMMILVPVSDYKAFIGNFTGATTAGDVTTAQMGGGGTSYIANWGSYAAIASQQNLVAKKPAAQGLTATGMAAKELADKDIVAYFNLKGARPKLTENIAKARDGFNKDFERNMSRGMAPARRPGTPPGAAAAPAQPDAAQMKYMPVVKAFISRFFDLADQFVKDADGATYGISITNTGLKITGLGEFNAGTQSAQAAAMFKGTDQPMLAGIPTNKYLFLFGMQQGNVAESGKLLDTFVAPVQQEATKLGADGKPILDYITAMKQYAAASKSAAFGMPTPSGQLGQEAIIQMLSVINGDSKAMLEAQKLMVTSQQQFMDMFMPAQARGMMKMTYTPAAKSLDGVEFNQFKTTVTAPPGQAQSPQMMQMKQMMTWMYGPQGMNGLVGAIGADKVIGAVDTNDAMVSKLIAAAKANQDVITPGLAAIDAQLPKSRLMAGYFQLDQFATTLANYAKMFGMPVNFQLPQNLPPIGGTLATEGNAVRADIYVPTQTLQSVIAAGIQSYMQMQGGQAPGGPGGL